MLAMARPCGRTAKLQRQDMLSQTPGLMTIQANVPNAVTTIQFQIP